MATKDQNTNQGSKSGVIKVVGSSQLPQEFITIGATFEEALGRCVFRDEQQRNDVNIYKDQLEMFDMTDEIESLTNWLNGSLGIGGYNRSLAAMTHAGVIIPELAGIKLSKQGSKEYIEAQRRFSAQKDAEKEEKYK